MSEQFDGSAFRKFIRAVEGVRFQASRKRKEIIGDTIPAHKRAINQSSVHPVSSAIFTRRIGKSAANNFACRDDLLQQHVGTNVAVLVAINVRRSPAIKADKFIELGVIDVADCRAQSGMVQKLSILAERHETNHPVMTFCEGSRFVMSKFLVEIQMQADINSNVFGDFCRALGILHEHHRTDGLEATCLKAGERSLRFGDATAPIVGIDD